LLLFVILAFTALMLLVGRQKGYPVRKNSGPKSLGTVVNVVCRVQPEVPCGCEKFWPDFWECWG